MSTVNQLLAKAMNTASDDEAMACLRMARKKATTLENGLSNDYKGHDAKYWHDRAVVYYNQVTEKPKAVGLSVDQQHVLWNMYKNSEQEKAKLMVDKRELEGQIRRLKSKTHMSLIGPLVSVIAFQAAIIIMLTLM